MFLLIYFITEKFLFIKEDKKFTLKTNNNIKNQSPVGVWQHIFTTAISVFIYKLCIYKKIVILKTTSKSSGFYIYVCRNTALFGKQNFLACS